MIDTPKFTTVLIDMFYMAEVEELELQIEQLKSALLDDNDQVIGEIKNHVDKSLDDRDVTGQGFGITQAMLQRIYLFIEQSGK